MRVRVELCRREVAYADIELPDGTTSIDEESLLNAIDYDNLSYDPAEEWEATQVYRTDLPGDVDKGESVLASFQLNLPDEESATIEIVR